MRIALISTCSLPVPPAAYGGIERFVATLAERLVSRGHDVVVYATGDSVPAGRLRFCVSKARWPIDFTAERRHAEFAWRDLEAWNPDVVHCNLPDALIAELAAARPTLATIHHERMERLLPHYLQGFARCVALSGDHASRFPELGPPEFVYHGLDPASIAAGPGDGGYVAFLGRIGPEKAPHLAIEAASHAAVPINVAGPHWHGIPRYDDYFAQIFLRALQRAGDAQWLGELATEPKHALLGRAMATLVPLGWDEPFGLVVIESMLAGTPVIAFRRGSMPEIIEDGVTGYLVDDEKQMADAIEDVARFDRAGVRERAIQRFNADRMASAYEAQYQRAREGRVNGLHPLVPDVSTSAR